MSRMIVSQLETLMTKRKRCSDCPWATKNAKKFMQWRNGVEQIIFQAGCAPVQGCHKLNPEQQIPLAEREQACIGHLEYAFQAEQMKQQPNEETLQELSLLACEN